MKKSIGIYIYSFFIKFRRKTNSKILCHRTFTAYTVYFQYIIKYICTIFIINIHKNTGRRMRNDDILLFLLLSSSSKRPV